MGNKQWGNGYHTGKKEGLSDGYSIGKRQGNIEGYNKGAKDGGLITGAIGVTILAAINLFRKK